LTTEAAVHSIPKVTVEVNNNNNKINNNSVNWLCSDKNKLYKASYLPAVLTS
jgi:hypothetical protein